VILALTLPATVLLALTIPPVVSVFGFGESGTNMVIWTTRAFLLGLAGHSLLEIGARGFYAQQNAITPLWASALMAAVFTALAILFARSLSTPGIALANAVAFTGEALILLFLLNRKFPGVLQVGNTLMRVIAACVISGVLVYILVSLSLPIPPLITATGALVLGGVATIPLIWPELKLMVNL
jgi:putative peptidoglycan lipid II flippase